jgi:hypothetical protein
MTLHPIPSEFPYIYMRKVLFSFSTVLSTGLVIMYVRTQKFNFLGKREKLDFCNDTILKVPKRENFSFAFFALSEPIWVCDLGTRPKNQFFII